MVANINNFGVINFYENSNSKSDSSKKSEPICQDATPAEDSSIASDNLSDIPLFKYIHPSVTDENEMRKIDKEVRNLVRNLSMPDICKYLMEMRKDNKVYLNVKPEAMFAELHRLGMPDESTPGFSKKNFISYFGIK